MRSAIVLSGGMDSTVALYQAVANGTATIAVSVEYGQRHNVEIRFARYHADRLAVPFVYVDLHQLGAELRGSALTDRTVPVPEGHYESDIMRDTVVPNRNMVLLSTATAIAIAHGCDTVIYGPHKGDHAVYPDCRVEFIDAMRSAMSLCGYQPISLDVPFIDKTKADIVRVGTDLAVDFAKTWSCYKGGSMHCGRCGTCVERREAFDIAGINDPTEYLCSK